MKLKKLSAIAVALSLTIGALSIPDHFSSLNNYDVIAATVPEDAPKSLADIEDTSSWYYQSCPTIGDVKALCFLVDFPDVKNENSLLNAETTKEALNSRVSEFYNTSSYGKLNIDFDVYGWYTFENSRDYCGAELGYQGMLREVMEAYDDIIDYSEYDANNDGMLDLVYLFYAGPNDGSGNHFWWSFVTNGLGDEKFDNNTIPKFAFINLESSQYNYLHYRDWDTVIHETGHILGLADYYDVNMHGGLDSAQHGNTGGFDIMDFMEEGDHNIFSKMMLGWVDPVFVTEDMTFDVNCVSDETAKAYIIAPNFENGVFSEYFVVEFYKNIENNQYSIKCPEGAVRIYHADATYDSNTFIYDNSGTEHPLLNLVESDGEYANLRYEDLSYTKDYYTAGMTFGINTSPSTEFYDGEYTGINITVNSIDGDSANVTVTFDNVDDEAPKMTKYVMPNAFGRVTNLSGTQIYFSSHIFEGENFNNISYSPVASPDEKVYPESYIVKHPQSKNYSFNSIFITGLSYMKDNTDYVLTIPAGAVVDSSGNPNEETTIRFTTCGGTSTYTEVEYPDFEKIASGAPEDSMMDTNYLERLPLKNGNTLFVHRLLVPIGEYTRKCGYDFKIYSPQNELVVHTYIKDDKYYETLNLFELNNDTLLFATCRNYYYIVSLDGVILEDGTYYEGDHSDISCFRIFENSIDFIDGFDEIDEFYICRFNFDGTIERFGPILPLPSNIWGSQNTEVVAKNLHRYNSDYTEFDSDEQNGISAIVDTRSFYYEKYEDYFASGYGISRFHGFDLEEGNDAYYADTYISDNYIGYISTVHDSEVLCNKTAKNGVPLVDVNGGYVANLIGASEFLLNDDGQLMVYDVEIFFGTGQFHDADGYFIVRLNKDLEVMWDCAVPFFPRSAFCSGDKVYVFSNDGIYAFDDSATEPIFAKDEVSFTDTFEVDTENQEIKGAITTAEQLKTNLVASDADVIIYDLDGRTIPDSENIEEAIVEINLHNSAYTYYFHYISAENYNISVTMTTSSDDLSNVKVELIDSEGELVQTAQISDTGFEFTDVEKGKYTVVVSAPKYCPKEYSVEIGEENLELDVEIHRYADVNFDGILDSKDATQILHYSSQVVSLFASDDELTSEYRFKVADVDKNGIIDSKDATQVLRYASDLPSLLDNL